MQHKWGGGGEGEDEQHWAGWGRRSSRKRAQGNDCCWNGSRCSTSRVGEGRERGRMSSIGRVGGGGAAGRGRVE